MYPLPCFPKSLRLTEVCDNRKNTDVGAIHRPYSDFTTLTLTHLCVFLWLHTLLLNVQVPVIATTGETEDCSHLGKNLRRTCPPFFLGRHTHPLPIHNFWKPLICSPRMFYALNPTKCKNAIFAAFPFFTQHNSLGTDPTLSIVCFFLFLTSISLYECTTVC